KVCEKVARLLWKGESLTPPGLDVQWTLCVPPTQCQVTASPTLTVTSGGANLSPPWPTFTSAGAAAAGAASTADARPEASASERQGDRRIRRSPRGGAVRDQADGGPPLRRRFGPLPQARDRCRNVRSAPVIPSRAAPHAGAPSYICPALRWATRAAGCQFLQRAVAISRNRRGGDCSCGLDVRNPTIAAWGWSARRGGGGFGRSPLVPRSSQRSPPKRPPHVSASPEWSPRL